MNVLIIGSGGFLGRHLIDELSHDNNMNIYRASHEKKADVLVNLLDKETIHAAIDEIRPDVIINCAGVVMGDHTAKMNVEFCRNLFEALVEAGGVFPKVILAGSASVYGIVAGDSPVAESTPLNPSGLYAESKMFEEKLAIKFANQYGINVVVARIFNPIGSGMGEKFLITNLLKQINSIKNGESNTIEISRLDSKRDYVDVRDLARALHMIAVSGNDAQPTVVNIGSGRPTSNGEVLEKLLSLVELDRKPTIIETKVDPEPRYADCADISLIKSVYGWNPKYDLGSTIKEIINESK